MSYSQICGAWTPRWRVTVQQFHHFQPICSHSALPRPVRSLSSRCTPSSSQTPLFIPHTHLHQGDVPAVDALVVLAGGQDDFRESQLPVWVERRLDACASLLVDQPPATKILCSGGGTPHKRPILGPSGFFVFESMSCASYLMNRGVPSQSLLKETASYDTIGNGYFATTVHALPRRWESLCIVTSEFHMPRSKAIFQTLAHLLEKDVGWSFDLHCVEISDEGVFDDAVLTARKHREQQSLDRFREDMQEIGTLGAFSDWLHDTHLCYAVSRQHEIGLSTGVSDKALASY